MKKLLLFFIFILIAQNGFCVSEWDKSLPAYNTTINGGDDVIRTNNEALDRVLSNYRQGMSLQYLSASTLTVTLGEVVCSNSGGTIRKLRSNTSGTTVTWSDIDTGSEGSSTTYWVYANCDATATTATFKISTSSTAPTGLTYYKRLGSFYNDGSSNITLIANDNTNFGIDTGTISSGSTISVPSGFSASECNWMVGVGSLGAYTGGDGDSMQSVACTVDSSRLVTCTGAQRDNGTNTGTANYIIVCHR